MVSLKPFRNLAGAMPEWLRMNALYFREFLSNDSDDPDDFHEMDDADRVTELKDANIISSEVLSNLPQSRFHRKQMHKVFVDLDMEHWYVPSSTPGHGHLYINRDLTLEQLKELMGVLEKFGIVSKGWTYQLETRGGNTFRLPGVKKEKN